MYSALFRALPGPTWVKAILFFLILLGIIAVLFTWVFPWMAENFSMFNTTVG